MGPEQQILELAHEVGFDLAGIAPALPPPDAERFGRWIAAGRHGSMAYLERNAERIADPRRVVPGARSLLVVGFAHSREAFRLSDGTRVARYAAGRDYHNVMGRMLRRLARRIEGAGLAGRGRAVVDAGPVLERSHAARAGLGFASKAANLLHPRFGPWFFLGELLLEVELSPTEGPLVGTCGTCRACLDACPTGAILEPGLVDSRRCISYQTIENRGPQPRGLRPAIGEWGFGCDVCSEVCPIGRDAPDLAERFGVHPALADSGVVSWLGLGDAFDTTLEGSPLRRPRREGLARNAAIVLGNRPSDRGRAVLLEALGFDPSPLVREAAAWSLARAHLADAGTRPALETAAATERDPLARRAMRVTLERSL